MPTFSYNPGPDDPEFIRTHNRTFKAGESFEVADDDPLCRKFRGHPQFNEEGATPQEETNQEQAKLNADARTSIARNRREVGRRRSEAQAELARAEAEERRLTGSERALGELSPAEIRAMEQVQGETGSDNIEEDFASTGGANDGTSGGGVVGRQSGAGTAGGLNPDNQAKSEDRPQR
jgi:hypothetical protein